MKQALPRLERALEAQLNTYCKSFPLTPCLCPQLVMEVLSQLEGASALLFKSSHYPGQMVACRRGSPLIVGIREPKDTKSGSAVQFEAFVASDGAAVVEHTKQ